jgi:aspartyl-tRNA(Asn)/glutamyl-tRNA(Gln) amidotransferase subunit A
MSELAFMTLAEASRRIRTRELSPVELTRALLERIAAIDSEYNAFIVVTGERALEEARAAEAEIARGNYRGAMHGIPYAAKDLFDVAGIATTCHSKLRVEHRAKADSFVVAKLRAAGAVLLGKTALHEFATGGPVFDLPWPPARNPWDRGLHPGGSSSGSGTAVALGMAPAALGTDTGGSVRNPATCCGIVGLKPTYGAVSRSGVFPLSFSLDHVGPMTRTVEDNAILFHAIAGHDPAEAASARRPAADCLSELKSSVKGLRVGVIEHFFREDMEADPEQVRAFDEALDVLRRIGVQLKTIRLSPLSQWGDCGRTILQAESYAIHERSLQERPEDYAALTREKLLPGAFIAAHDYVKAQQWRTVLAREFTAAMQDLDAVVTISSMTPPCRIDDPEALARTYEKSARMPFNVTGTPAIAVPTGFTAADVPLGMQIGARAFDEPTLYRLAHAFCAATGFTERRPTVAAAQQAAAQ